MIQFDRHRQMPQSVVIVCGFILLLLCYHLIFGNFFPNFRGKLGQDYSLLFPALLDGYFWFKNNSLSDVPWFTPSFCGGQPYFADVQSGYYSAVQFLTFFFNPLTSVYISILLFASFGFWGMFALLRLLFKTSHETAFLAASLFMFNGFYIHRMMVGHFGFQGIMLVPFIAFLLLYEAPAKNEKLTPRPVFYTIFAGVLIAYWLQSGLTSLMIPASLTVLGIACLYNFGNWQSFLFRSMGAVVVSLALSVSKLVAGFAFMANFGRNDYSLPGFNSGFNALKTLLTVLFIAPADIEEIALSRMANMQWMLTQHEWEFSVTFIPALIILIFWVARIWMPLYSPFNKSVKSQLALAVFGIVLLLPLVLNVYQPEWNAILKKTPLIKSSSALVRWWIIYIPVIIIYAAIAFESLVFLKKYRDKLVVGSVFVIIILNLTQDTLYYDLQGYNGNTIIEAYHKVSENNLQPKIHDIDISKAHVDGNDILVLGISQLGCYNPSFGYRLEYLPFKTLHPGSIFEQKDGYLNLKNPACYVFPKENNCLPGDHFKVSQKAQAELFAEYKPFAFEIPLKQKIANGITQFALGFVLAFLGVGFISTLQQTWASLKKINELN